MKSILQKILNIEFNNYLFIKTRMTGCTQMRKANVL